MSGYKYVNSEGRKVKYMNDEEKIEAVRQQKREWYQRNKTPTIRENITKNTDPEYAEMLTIYRLYKKGKLVKATDNKTSE